MPELSTHNHEGLSECIFLIVRVRLRALTRRMRSALNTWLIKIVNTSRTCLLFSAYPLIAMWPITFFFSLIQLWHHALQQVDNDSVGRLLGSWVESSKYHFTNFFSDFLLSFLLCNLFETWPQMNTENVWFADAPKRKYSTRRQCIHRKNI